MISGGLYHLDVIWLDNALSYLCLNGLWFNRTLVIYSFLRSLGSFTSSRTFACLAIALISLEFLLRFLLISGESTEFFKRFPFLFYLNGELMLNFCEAYWFYYKGLLWNLRLTV